MPLYEGKSILQEKQAIVFDIGSAYTKFGFAGESSPRCIIASEYLCEKTGNIKNVYDYKTPEELYDSLVEFIQILCFRYGLVSPKDRKSVIVESLLCPTVFRETLAKVLFCHFEVSGILFLPSHLISLCTLAVDTALVIDLGYREAVCIPVYSGIAVLRAWQAQPLSAASVHEKIRKEIEPQIKHGVTITESHLEDIKVRTCLVTNLDRANKYLLGTPPPEPPSVEYSVGGQQILNISGKLRETAFEVLFPRDNDNMSLGNMILDAIINCPVDMRKDLAENIFLVGGGVMCPGLKPRLKAELMWLSNTVLYKEKLATKVFKFHSAPAKANYTSWLGGAIYGGTDVINTRCLTKEMYAKNPHVPDWSNLSDNKRPAGSK